jgi:hypothetical protein
MSFGWADGPIHHTAFFCAATSERTSVSSVSTSSGSTSGALTLAHVAPWITQTRPSSNRETDDPGMTIA